VRQSQSGFCANIGERGTWRSLVARLLWEQEVAGSNPAVPTESERLPVGGRGQTIEAMSLLAYSVRRAAGSLLVLLIVIWIVEFAVYHVKASTTCKAPRGCVPTAIERNIFPWLRIQPTLADEWTKAGVQVGLGVLATLGAGAALHLRRRRAG
jgi:hypothetical protein